MRNFICILIATVLVFSLAGCSSNANKDSTPSVTYPDDIEETMPTVRSAHPYYTHRMMIPSGITPSYGHLMTGRMITEISRYRMKWIL